MNHRCQVGVLAIGLWLSAGQAVHAQQAVGATFGDVIQLTGGTPSDIVLDELRHQLYLVSNTTSQVLVYDYTTNQMVAKIATGRTPLLGWDGTRRSALGNEEELQVSRAGALLKFNRRVS